MTRSLLCLCLVALVGCDDGEPEIDSGMPDAGSLPDAGPPYTCESTVQVQGVLGGVVSAELDTSTVTEAPRDLGYSCGNPDAETRWAPQAVVELAIPGMGPVAVRFSTVNEVTPDNFSTVVQVRRDCELVPDDQFPPLCVDAADAPNEWRSQGAFEAMGGETVYVVVSGYGDAATRSPGLIDRGPVRIDFEVAENRAPTLDAAEMVLIGDDLRLDVSGMDADGNVNGVVASFYDRAGLIDLYGTGNPTELNSLFFIPLDDPAPTAGSFEAGSWLRSTPGDGRTQLGEFLAARGANMARVIMVDQLSGTSAPLMIPLVEATIVGFGDACSTSERCSNGYVCGPSNTCEPSPEAIALCGTATNAMLPAFTDQAVTVTMTGQTTVDPGLHDPLSGCVMLEESAGDEAIYQVDVATGPFDLILDTNLPITGRTDTVIYVRTDCADPSTESACNDDLSATDRQSHLELMDLEAGTYFVFVEQVLTSVASTSSHALEITARPVLPMGAACDDAGVLNRCANGPCAASVCP